MKIFPLRSDFPILATYRSGVSEAIAMAMAWVNRLAASQSAPSIGSTTCKPFPPESLTKLSRSTAASRSRNSLAAAAISRQAIPSPGGKRKEEPITDAQPIDRCATNMHFGAPRLHQRNEPLNVFDGNDLPALAVDHDAQISREQTG